MGDQAAVSSSQLRVPKGHRRALLLYQVGEPLALEKFALLARKGALQSAPRGVRPGEEEAAALRRGKSKLISRKKKKSKPKHPKSERVPLLRAPSSSWAMHPSRVPASGFNQGQSGLEPLRCPANEVTESAKTLEAREGLSL